MCVRAALQLPCARGPARGPLALHRLDVWGVPYGSETSDTAALVVAELAANAVTHGRVRGRDFEVRLSLDACTLRIDVSDPRGERRPDGPDALTARAPALARAPGPAPTGTSEPTPADVADGGRGLLLVDALADRWAVLDRAAVDRAAVGKTVRAELDLPR